MKKLIVATTISMLLAGSAMAAPIAQHDANLVNFSANLLPNVAPTCSATLSATEAVVYWRNSGGHTIVADQNDNLEFDGSFVEVAVEQSAARVTAIKGALPVLEGVTFELESYRIGQGYTFHAGNPEIYLNAGEAVEFTVIGMLAEDTTMADVAGADGFQATYTLPISYACTEYVAEEVVVVADIEG